MLAWFIGVALIVSGHFIARRMQAKAGAPLVRHLRLMRSSLTQIVRREPAHAGHPRLEAHASHYDSASRELASREFVILGDLVEYKPDGTEAGVARWFAAKDGTISGWLAVVVTPEGSVPVTLLITELEPRAFVVTLLGGPTSHLAAPPMVQRTVLEPSLGLDAAIETHRRTISLRGPASPRPVHSLDDAIAVTEALRSHTNEWRAQQTPAELLDLDIRAMLTEPNDKLVRLIKRLMPNHE